MMTVVNLPPPTVVGSSAPTANQSWVERYEALGTRRGVLLDRPDFGEALRLVVEEMLDVRAHTVHAGDFGLLVALVDNRGFFFQPFNRRQPWAMPEGYPSPLTWFLYTDSVVAQTLRAATMTRRSSTQDHLQEMSTPEKVGSLHWLAAVLLWWDARLGEGHTPSSAQVMLGLLLPPGAFALLDFPDLAPPRLRATPPSLPVPPIIAPPVTLDPL